MSDLDAILDAAVEEVAAPAPAAPAAPAAEEEAPQVTAVDDDELNSPTVSQAPPAAAAQSDAQAQAMQMQMGQLFGGIPSMEEMQREQEKKVKKTAPTSFMGIRTCERITRISVYVGLAAFIWTAGGIRSSP